MSNVDTLHQRFQAFSETHVRRFNTGQRYFYRTDAEATTMHIETQDREQLFSTCQEALRDIHDALLPAAAAVLRDATEEVTLFSADSPLTDREFMITIPDVHLLQVYNELLRLSSAVALMALQYEQNPDPQLIQEQTTKLEASNQQLERLLGFSLIDFGRTDASSHA